uniref:Uncharacterized protein n=1 Tax=uncultured prokaryote TaxID=198431 RepID=H5SKC7_9ZZZZ|nr:hypothetical protein HGMM_F41E03C24 [uncultured prokaryote]
MKRWLLALALIIVAFLKPTNVRAGDISLEYQVRLEHPETHQANVWMKVTGVSQPTLYLEIYLRSPSFLTNLTVTDGSGNPLPFSLSGGTLTIQTQGSPEAIVDYSVEPSDWFGSDAHRAEKALQGMLRPIVHPLGRALSTLRRSRAGRIAWHIVRWGLIALLALDGLGVLLTAWAVEVNWEPAITSGFPPGSPLSVQALVVGPGGELYAGTWGGGVFRSDDGGGRTGGRFQR